MSYLKFLPYLVVCTAYCIDVCMDAAYNKYLKPLLIPTLLLGYLLCGAPVNWIIVLGAVLGWVGDVALMMRGDKWFIAGLGSFLLGHVAYAVWMFSNVKGPGAWWALCYLPIVCIALWLVYRYLQGGLGNMKPAVLAYMFTISIMSLAAFALMASRPSPGTLIIWLGSVSFIVSDCILACGLFASRLPNHDFLVMSTYMLAQLGVVLGTALSGL